MTRTTRLIIAASLILAVVGAAAYSRAQKRPTTSTLRAVAVVTAQQQALDGELHATGFLTPKDEMRLSFKVGGVIDSIPVEEGQTVKSGQVLASLKQTEMGASVEQARQATEKARRDLHRGQALLADGVTTEEAVQDLTTAYKVAAAAQKGVEFNAQHARIVAGANGVVLRKLGEFNEVVQAGQPVLILGGAQRGWVVRVGLADRDVVRMQLGAGARIEFDAWPDRTFQGTVSNIASAADAATGTFTVELRLDPGDAHFVQGLVAKVKIDTHASGSTQVLPVQALLEANDKEAGVFVYDSTSQKVHRITVQIGRMNGGRVQVIGGLPARAQVVVDGAAFLQNGETVRVVSQ